MKILFKNTTKYDKENIENFLNFHQQKYGKKEIRNALLWGMAILYITICNMININLYFWLILLPICIVCYFIKEYLIKKRKIKNKKQKNKELTLFFYERYIKVKFKRQFYRMNYFELKKIFETDEKFFLYIEEKESLILDKEGFSIGTPKGFTEFIKRKCPFRYNDEKNKKGGK